MTFQIFNRRLQSFDAVLKASQSHIAKAAEKFSCLAGSVIVVKMQLRLWIRLAADGALTILPLEHPIILFRRKTVSQSALILVAMIASQVCLSVLFLLFWQGTPLLVAVTTITRKGTFFRAISLKLFCKSCPQTSRAFFLFQLNGLITPVSRTESRLTGFGFHPSAIFIQIAKLTAIVMAVFMISARFIELGEWFVLLAIFTSLVWYSSASHSLNLLNVLKLWLGRLKSYLGRPSPLYHAISPSFTDLLSLRAVVSLLAAAIV